MIERLCVDGAGKLLELCDRDGERESYLAPHDHRVGVTLGGTLPANEGCAWNFDDGDGHPRRVSGRCDEEVKARLVSNRPTIASVDVILTDGTALRLVSEIVVRDALIAGMLAGRGNAAAKKLSAWAQAASPRSEPLMEDVDITLQPRKLFKGNPPLSLSDNLAASWWHICHVPAGMCEVDWHNPPQRLLVLNLTGEAEYETSDGDIRRAAAGSVVLAEDTTGKGHISRHPPDVALA